MSSSRIVIDPEALRLVHALGLTDRRMAEHFGVSLSTLKRHKRRQALGSTHRATQTGRLGERLSAEHLQALGMTVEPMPQGAPYDLLVNGWRVDVKTSSVPTNGRYRYHLAEERPSFHGQYRYAKDYDADTDFLLLAVVKDMQLSAAYVVPVAERHTQLTVQPDSPFCPLTKYRSAWHFLTPRSSVAA